MSNERWPHKEEEAKPTKTSSLSPDPSLAEGIEDEASRTLFGKTAVLLKMVTQEQVNNALLCAVTSHRGKKLGEILMALGYLSEKEVELILSKQKTKIMVCPQCQHKYQILLYQENRTYECRVCHVELMPPGKILETMKEKVTPVGLNKLLSARTKGHPGETQSFHILNKNQQGRLYAMDPMHKVGSDTHKISLTKEVGALPTKEVGALPTNEAVSAAMNPFPPTERKKILSSSKNEEENSYKMQIGLEGKTFPALGYNALPQAARDFLPKYERRCYSKENDTLLDLLGWYGCSDVNEIVKGQYGSCYLAISKDANDLVFIKHSTQEAAILTYHIEVLAHLLLEGVAHISKTVRLIHTKTQGSFLIQKFCAGEPLSEIVVNQGKIPLDAALYVAQQIADILMHVHAQGVVHFDLKPRNILVDGTTWEIFLVDFGCSIYLGEREKISYEEMGVGAHDIFGTPSYMAVEQITKKEISRATDQVPLGCILYRMITGNKLYQGENLAEILKNKLEGRTEQDIANLSDLPCAVRNILLRSIARFPQDRYRNMRELGHSVMQARLALKENRFTKDLL